MPKARGPPQLREETIEVLIHHDGTLPRFEAGDPSRIVSPVSQQQLNLQARSVIFCFMENVARDRLHEVVREAFASFTEFDDEDHSQTAFVAKLGDSERELRATFAPPRHPQRRPPQSAIDELARREPPVRIGLEGRDPCAKAARMDVLWHAPFGLVPIELKYVKARSSDVYGYQFLKDLHRLERMVAAGRHQKLSDRRFAIFATNEPVYWKGGRPEPEPFWRTDGSRRSERTWIQYDQSSAHTLWYGYPPFYLANSYEFAWHDLDHACRYLLIEVTQQR